MLVVCVLRVLRVECAPSRGPPHHLSLAPRSESPLMSAPASVRPAYAAEPVPAAHSGAGTPPARARLPFRPRLIHGKRAARRLHPTMNAVPGAHDAPRTRQ
ncbi:hypothetical protein GCM10023336_43360 [Streptomyces similanensis]|uniref:Secreted protein n=1 Tax=Streptomyces similanensis TaxID=1274988 RepID=A0ABP9KTQ3_9ACTN